MKKIVVALGGNAIISSKQKGTYKEQIENISKTTVALAELVKAGHQLIITHGNGPQVGNLLIQHSSASDQVPELPLDVCGAQTQGQLGYLISQQLQNVLKSLNIQSSVASVITQVLVDKNDPGFQNPSKPIGPFYDKAWADTATKNGISVIEDAGRGWRKVVASPKPIEIVELDLILEFVNNNAIVIAAGGGGIPVVESENGSIKGIEAVIDKDRTGALLAKSLKADVFMILTDVDYVAINFNQPDQKNLEEVSVSDLEKHLSNGHFGKGSMAPKVEAVIDFVKSTGGRAIITHPNKALSAIEGKAGTRVV